ncbi:Bacterial regulatory protein, luxR family [compost metagenome]
MLVTLLEQQEHPQHLTDLFQLTTAEQRLAELLCVGLQPRECAERLDTSINTVRSQLRSLFRKTGTERQTELVRLLIWLQQR